MPVLAEPVEIGSFVVDGGEVTAVLAFAGSLVVDGPVVIVVDAPAVVDA